MTIASTQVARVIFDLSKKWGPEIPILTPLKLMKMTFIAHGWHLGLYHASLIDEDAYAWTAGPVFKDLYNATSIYRMMKVEKVPLSYFEQHQETKLSDAQVDLINAVEKGYGALTEHELCAITMTKGSPWERTVEMNNGKLHADLVISKELTENYYIDLKNKPKKEVMARETNRRRGD